MHRNADHAGIAILVRIVGGTSRCSTANGGSSQESEKNWLGHCLFPTRRPIWVNDAVTDHGHFAGLGCLRTAVVFRTRGRNAVLTRRRDLVLERTQDQG